MKGVKKITQYLISDYLTASLAWFLFSMSGGFNIKPFAFDARIFLKAETKLIPGMLAISCFWILLYYLSGYYKDIYRKSRLKDILLTFLQSFFGVIIIFFFLLPDYYFVFFRNYHQMFMAYFSLHYILTLVPRYILTSFSIVNIKNGRLYFNTIIIGNNRQSLKVYDEFKRQAKLTGNRIIGFVDIKNNYDKSLTQELKMLGSLEEIREIIHKHNIEEVIIALEPSEQKHIDKILNLLAINKVIIKAIPGMSDILSGKVKVTHLFAIPLIQISHDLMPVWQKNIKQLSDILLSVLSLLILSPLIIFLIIYIRLTSKGPIIHAQERIGMYGKPFKIYKFRSMFEDAEKYGPELSSKEDPRLTKIGKFMRKFRMDEIPNFVNVIKGEMSLVGPRPERQFYIDQIVKKAPHYIHLQKVKPGITSLGQVKYGYAKDIEQMIKRLQYDILYIENMSLLMDLKIIGYTFLIILKGKGI